MRRATLDAGWRDRLACSGLSDAAALLNQDPDRHVDGRWELLSKPGLGGRQRWRWQLTGEGVLYVKRYLRSSLGEQLDRVRRQAPRHSRAWWEYHQSLELSRRYIPVARAVGFAEEMSGLVEVRSAVILESVPGDAFDRVWPRLVAHGSPLTRGPARQELARALARLVSAFHQTGTCHRDLYLCHIFIDLDPSGRRPPGLALIDLARTHRPWLRRLRWVLKDLSQLDSSARQIGASRTDRMRFLVTYLGLEPREPRVRYYARRIVRKSDRILRRIARKSRGA